MLIKIFTQKNSPTKISWSLTHYRHTDIPSELCGRYKLIRCIFHRVVVSALHSGWENPSSSLPINFELG